MFFQTPSRTRRTRIRSTFIRFASVRASCGVTRHRRATRSISIFGMTILSQPDSVSPASQLAAFRGLARDTGGPVFAEPWQAQAFGLAVKLSELGYFTWNEWAAALAAELKAAAGRAEPAE